jgi:hypothetical protein
MTLGTEREPIAESSMSKAYIKTVIDHHCRYLRGIQHEFKLQWVALEPRWASRSITYLLAIEVLSETDAGVSSTTLYVVTRAGTTRADLLRLVDDALDEHLESGHRLSATARESGQLHG